EEVFRLVDAPGSLVLRELWIWAERTAAIDLAGGRVRRQDRAGRRALLAPVFERRQRVEDVGALAAAAVSHARRVEQAQALIDRLPADGLDDAVVVHQRRARRDVRIRPPLVDEQLAPAREERCEVR